jgi:hypothetical protein
METINLRQARKAKARAAHAKKGDENRVAFGQSKAQRSLQSAQRDAQNRALDGLKRVRDRGHEPG